MNVPAAGGEQRPKMALQTDIVVGAKFRVIAGGFNQCMRVSSIHADTFAMDTSGGARFYFSWRDLKSDSMSFLPVPA